MPCKQIESGASRQDGERHHGDGQPDQVPGNNGRRVPQTPTARTTSTQPRHGRLCQATPKPARGALQGAAPHRAQRREAVEKQSSSQEDEVEEKQ